ncbi:maestro heat-like repeat-containing protein family member 7 [Mastomys coucha]|uniref:maestro heat-like repeat-containing protein family member 7 n=1 Tax=Mastomys coucha TaxID=35658 RepID=UPI001261C669|nr:maestro heat-like repeat-containing protein family member 7 [Mastomys coucha]XP_031197415.1 maestro heat-like repeat-containing protein family member 7 [Mastomys coucha]
MSLHLEEESLNKIAFRPSLYDVLLKPSLSGLCQSEKEAYQLILDFMEPGQMSQLDKLSFLNAVATLSSVVRDQANGNMNNYYPKTLLAKKIETFILEEPTGILDSSLRQQAMLCIVALSQVKPPFHLCQKLDLVNVSITSTFSLPLIMPSLDRKESASLYLQTIQALDDMLQALVMEDMCPNMVIVQNFVEIILPWLTLSDKMHEQIRALGTISRLLRFICNFSELSHMASFSIIGKLMGTFSIFCLNPSQDICTSALEALNYLLIILVLQRSVRSRTEAILKDLQKHFRGNLMANMQSLTLFFRKYLTPVERADVILLAMESIINGSLSDVFAASKMLKMILRYSVKEVAKVPEIIKLIYYHIDRVTQKDAQNSIKKIFQLLVQSHTDEVILTLFKIKDQSQRETHKSWEILASIPKGYQVIMEYLLQRIISPQEPKDQEADHETELSTLIATRAIHELLLVPSQQFEVQSFFASLFVALLFQISSLVTKGSTVAQDVLPETESVDTVSSSVEALKTLMRSSGYVDHMSYIQTLGGWELLVSPERHYEGVTLLARSLVVKNCWHNRPVFSFFIKTLQNPGCTNYLTALVFLTELLYCPDVAGVVDEVATKILADWFNYDELTTARLFLQITEAFAKHKNTIKHLSILQPFVLSCCYSSSSDLVMETFCTLQRILKDLTWYHSSSFIIKLTFTLAHFFEEESEQLRLITFEIYESILAKVSRMTLVFPMRHQILNLLILLVLHLKDVNAAVVKVCRLTLGHVAAILHWTKLKAVFAKNDVFTILSALLKQERNKVLWFLKQSVALFKSPQDPIRQVAVWFAGQIIWNLDKSEEEEIEEEFAAFRYMQRDPDPIVSCLIVQTLYTLEVKEKVMPAKTPSSCLCMRRIKRRWC